MGFQVSFKRARRIVLDESDAGIYEAVVGEQIAEENFVEDAFLVRFNIDTNSKAENIYLSEKESDQNMCHRKLGHCNFEYLKQMFKDDQIIGLPKL